MIDDEPCYGCCKLMGDLFHHLDLMTLKALCDECYSIVNDRPMEVYHHLHALYPGVASEACLAQLVLLRPIATRMFGGRIPTPGLMQ